MKLIRYGIAGREKTGVQIEGINYNTSAFGEDYNGVFFNSNGLIRLADYIATYRLQLQEIGKNERIGCPIATPSKIVGVGLNYADHAAETGATPPDEPILFLKSTTSLSGPYDNVVLPEHSLKTDWEVELAVVIGKKARYVKEENALEYIAGYALMNDISEREFQLERGGTWDKGKGCDTFGPVGPLLVTPNEIPDANNLRLWLSIDGQIVQDGNTSNLIFKVPALIAYISRMMTLLPGDIITTGTPAGVGLGRVPAMYLQPGNVMEMGIDGLGIAKQEVVAFQP